MTNIENKQRKSNIWIIGIPERNPKRESKPNTKIFPEIQI